MLRETVLVRLDTAPALGSDTEMADATGVAPAILITVDLIRTW